MVCKTASILGPTPAVLADDYPGYRLSSEGTLWDAVIEGFRQRTAHPSAYLAASAIARLLCTVHDQQWCSLTWCKCSWRWQR